MDLTEALRLSRHEIVTLVGGGGKTTTLFRLCHEATMRQRSYAACGTTRINIPPGLQASVISDEDSARLLATVRARLNVGEWALVVGGGYSDHDRLLPVSFEVVETIAGFSDLVAVEADGARMRPFKAPNEGEPPVPPATSLLVALVGADILGEPLDETHVHRPERVIALTGASLGDTVTPAMVAAVLAHPEGGRKNAPPGARFAVVINKVDPSRLAAARETAARLIEAGVERAVLAQVQEDPPVVEVVTA